MKFFMLSRRLTADDIVVQNEAGVSERRAGVDSGEHDREHGILHHWCKELCHWRGIGEGRVACAIRKLFQHRGTIGVVLAFPRHNQRVRR